MRITVRLATPHDGVTVRQWIRDNGIQYTFSTHWLGMVEYHFTNQADAVMFALRWA